MLAAGSYRQDITYWAPNSMDGFGNRTFKAPVLLKGRWEDRTDLNVGSNMEYIPSKARVYLPQAVELGGMLALGNYAEIETPVINPNALFKCYLIKHYNESPAITGKSLIRKAVM